MAKKVDSMPEGGRSNSGYNWDEWLDGDVWELTSPEDFKDIHSFRSSAYEAASKRGGKVTVRKIDTGTCRIQFTADSKKRKKS